MSFVAELESDRTRSRPAIEAGGPGIDPEYVATLAHEMRNALWPMGCALELLDMADIDEASASQARGVMGRQVRQLRRLVNDLLDAHRLACQQMRIIPSFSDLSTELETVCEDHRPLFASREITLTLDVMTRPVWLNVDWDRLGQALNNLLNNSLKFTDPGGSVRVALSVDLPTRSAVVSIRDNGIGIEPTVLQAIFEPHSHDSSCRNPTGLGLGLPLAKRLVELHGGQLLARSEGQGMGAEFRILLPLPDQTHIRHSSMVERCRISTAHGRSG